MKLKELEQNHLFIYFKIELIEIQLLIKCKDLLSVYTVISVVYELNTLKFGLLNGSQFCIF
jgi:hypothetical protein